MRLRLDAYNPQTRFRQMLGGCHAGQPATDDGYIRGLGSGWLHMAYLVYRIQVRNPMMVFPSSILPSRIHLIELFAENQRHSMRSSSIGSGSPAVSSVARKMLIFSPTNPGLGQKLDSRFQDRAR